MLGNTETVEEDFTVARLYVSKLKSEVKSIHTHNVTLESTLAEHSAQLDALKEQLSQRELSNQQHEAKIQSLSESLRENESKRRQLDDQIDSLNEELAKLRAQGGLSAASDALS